MTFLEWTMVVVICWESLFLVILGFVRVGNARKTPNRWRSRGF